MRILIDLQACQSGSRLGGIGRYSLNLIEAMARLDHGHELRVLLSDAMPESIPELYQRLSAVLPRRHIQVWQAPGPVAEHNPANRPRARAAELIRESCIERLRPDIVHVASLIEGLSDEVVSSVGELIPGDRTAVTLYDLIPLVDPERYLTDRRIREHYFRKLDGLRRAGGLLAISEFSRRQGIAELGVDPEHIVNIAAGLDPRFGPIELRPERVEDLRRRYGLPEHFVLFTGSFDPRKNQARLIQAYARLPAEFRQGRRLVIIGNGWEAIYNDLRQLAVASGLHPDEVLFAGHISDEELLEFYNLCDLFVFPSLSEGYGLPVLEAMACGVPVIASNTTSVPEVVGREDALFDPLDVEAMAAKMQRALSDATWRAQLVEHGRRQSRVFTWEATARRAIAAFEAQYARTRALERPTAVQVSDRTLAALRRLESQTPEARPDQVRIAAALAANEACLADVEPESPRIGWVTTWNTPCGIAMYAKYLAGAFVEHYHILASHAADTSYPDAPNVTRCWRIGDDDLRALTERIVLQGIDTLVIQFNFVFFEFAAFARFLREMLATGRRLFIVLHSTTDTPEKSLAELAPELALCDRLLVHSRHDEAALARLGLSANVERFAHGVPDLAPAPVALDIPAGRFVIASYGFFLPHKGLFELIEAIGRLVERHGLDVQLLMVNARYPVELSQTLIDQAHARVQAAGLDDRVTFITDFLDDPVSLGYLGLADLVVYAYQHTGESSSAAVRMGLAARRPVAVTPLAIFDDVDGVVHRLPGTDPEALAAGIAELAARLRAPRPDAALRRTVEQAETWFESHRYGRLAARLWARLNHRLVTDFEDPPLASIPADPGNGHLVRQPYTLLQVGPWVASRAPGLALDVLAALGELGEENLRLILAGPAATHDDPETLVRLKAQVEQLGLTECVEWRLGCSERELAAAYPDADLYLASGEPPDTLALGRALHHERLALVQVRPDRYPDWPESMRFERREARVLAERIRDLMHEAGRRREQLAAQRACLGVTGAGRELDIRLEGPYDSSYSLALVNSAIARALSERGDRISLWSTDGFGDNPPNEAFLSANPDLAAMHDRQPLRVEVTLRNLYPPRTNAMTGQQRVLGPYGWEESGFPRDWIQGFNRRLTGVLCMSDFVREILIANGLRVPAVTTGIVADGLLHHEPRALDFELPEGYRLLHISSGFPRKGVDRLLAGLERLPSAVTLIVKTFPNPHNDVARQLQALGYLRRPVETREPLRAVTPEAGTASVTRWSRGERVVLLIDADLPPEQIVWLYRQCDLLVAPSRGEGFGLPMAEAMLFGVPVVTTDSGGQRDFCTPETAWLVRSHQVPARTHFGLSGSCWAEPDAESLHESILAVMNATPEERALRTERARALILERYSAQAVAERIHQALDRFGASSP